MVSVNFRPGLGGGTPIQKGWGSLRENLNYIAERDQSERGSGFIFDPKRPAGIEPRNGNKTFFFVIIISSSPPLIL